MPIDPGTITWDNAPEPVPPTTPGRSGGVILSDPTAEAEEARKAREAARAEANLGLNVQSNERQEENQLFGNEQQLRQEFNKLPIVAEFQTVARSYSSALKTAPNGTGDQALITAYAKMLDPASVVREGEAAAVAGADSAIGSKIAQLKKDLGIEGGGQLSASQRARIRSEMRNLVDQYNGAYQQIRGQYGDLAKQYGMPVDRITGPDILDPYRKEIDDYWKKGGASALNSTDDPEMGISGKDETYFTDEDRALLGKLQSAYNAGASLEELQKITGEYGRVFPVSSQEELDKLREGGGQITVIPTGKRTAVEKAIGNAAESSTGAYFVGAANGLSSGGLDELVGVLGGDEDMAQAAKEALREKYPVSSAAGEVTGQMIQSALTRGAASSVGIGGKVAGTVGTVAQGTAYGAGEDNENRLRGAAIGATTAFAGQKLAEKLLAPAARAVIQRIAKEQNVPEEVVEQAAREALEAAEAKAPAALSSAEQTELGDLARKAVTPGPGAKAAREQLAILAQVNPEAKAAAERLGIELPVDILSDNAQVKTLTGLARSQISSDAQTAWGATVQDAMQKADDALREIGATPDLAQVSADTMERLTQNVDSLERQAVKLRGEVDDVIDVRDRVDSGNIKRAMDSLIEDMGGAAEAKQAMSSEERRLFDMLSGKTPPTYARLNSMRDQIGEALFKGKGPWADTSQANLAKYYKALADDQLAYIETKGGAELAEKMRGSNSLFSKMYDGRGAMQAVFGQQLDKSLTPLINRAITSGKKGDVQALNKLLETVPEDMRGQAVLSGIMADAQRGSAGGGFSFAKFAQTYRDLRANGPVYKQIADAVGPKGAQVLTDLYAVSRRMAEGESRIVRTGASNQPLINALNTESLLTRILKGTATRTAVNVTGAVGGGVLGGGPLGVAAGATVASAAQDALEKGGKTRLEKLHTLLSSDAFRGLIDKVGSGEEGPAINRLVGSKEWNNFAARVLGLKSPADRRAWLESAIRSTLTVPTVDATAETQPPAQLEVR